MKVWIHIKIYLKAQTEKNALYEHFNQGKMVKSKEISFRSY